MPYVPAYRNLHRPFPRICGVRWTPLDKAVEGAIDQLVGQIGELVNAGVLKKGQGNALTPKLEQALKRIDDGKYHVAVNVLQDFIGQLNDLVADGALQEAEAQPFIDQAGIMIWLLGG
jgi:C-terminal processing protease CtpA/Prc